MGVFLAIFGAWRNRFQILNLVILLSKKGRKMEMELGRKLCESLLGDGMVQGDEVQGCRKFEAIVDDILAHSPKYQSGDRQALNNLKAKLGKSLSIKARALNIAPQKLKTIKELLFNTINVKATAKATKRKLKIGRNREIYSSEEEDESVKEEEEENGGDVEETGSAPRPLSGKAKAKAMKRKYKIYDHDFKETVCEFATREGLEVACRKFKLPSRKITSWLEAYNLNLLGKGRKALDPVMQFHMCVWILKKIWQQVPLTQKIIRQKAATMKTNDIQFNGSKGWLQKFFLRHVELKSCFDTRNKLQSRQQSVKYHRSAFVRLMKDYENLQKLQIGDQVLKGDFAAIIYEKGDHPILKLKRDKNLDKQKLDSAPFYDYEKLKAMPLPDFKLKTEDNSSGDEDIGEEPEFESDQDDEDESYQEEEVSGKFKKEEESAEDQQAEIDIYEQDEESGKAQGQVKIQEAH